MTRLTFKAKLALGLGAMWLLFAFLGFVTYHQLGSVTGIITDFTQSQEPLNASAREIEVNLFQMTSRLRGYLLDHQHSHLEDLTGDTTELGNNLRRHQNLMRSRHNGMADPRLDEGFQQLVTMLGNLIETEDENQKKIRSLIDASDQLDRLIGDQVKDGPDPLGQSSPRKLEMALRMQSVLASAVRNVENYLQTESPRYEEGADSTSAQFVEQMRRFRALGPSPAEEQWAAKAQHLFDTTFALMRETIAVRKARSNGLFQILETRQKLEVLLNEEIYVQSMAVEQGKAAMRAAISRIITCNVLLLGVALVIGSAVAFFSVRSIADPVLKLVAVTRKVRNGDWTARAEVKSRDEFGILAEAFNQMIVARQEGEAALQQARQELEDRVAERTADLVQVNQALRTENVARQQTEEKLIEAKNRAEQAQRELQRINVELEASVNRALHLTELAETANRAKSHFLANISHEIRTPINGILGFTNLLLESEVPEDHRDSLNTIRTCSEDLIAVVNNILDYSKMEAGRMELSRVEFSVRERLDETMRLLAPSAHAKKLECSWRVGATVPERLVGDPMRLHQVLVNLVGNAVKFSQSGGILVEASCQPAADEDPEPIGSAGPIPAEGAVDEHLVLRFSVRDTGIGIAREKQAELFSAFSQVDGSSTREYGGTGLGLAISRQLTELMGGRIWVESEFGTGSVFSFTVRLAVPVAATVATSSTERIVARGARILLVEGNTANERLASELLRKRGHTVVCASHGREAVQWWERGQCHAILMDLETPEVEGWAAIAAIRDRERAAGRARFPIVAMVGRRVRDPGASDPSGQVDGWLVKPFNVDEFVAAVEGLLRNVRAAGKAA